MRIRKGQVCIFKADTTHNKEQSGRHVMVVVADDFVCKVRNDDGKTFAAFRSELRTIEGDLNVGQ